MTIYLTVIIVSVLYILLFILTRYLDYKDKTRSNIHILADNSLTDLYFYELIFYTGGRKDASTASKVSFSLMGTLSETVNRKLEPENKKYKILQRSAADTFIMSVNNPLGSLNYLRIWHDNSGQGSQASWFLKFVIVHDLQTREKYYFICNRWLGADRDDGQIDRILSVAGDKQKTELKYLLEKQTKEKMRDGHLWFSILARPTLSSFSRTDRLTCCFVLMYITMMMNILYYEQDTSATTGSLRIGPFSISQAQVKLIIWY